MSIQEQLQTRAGLIKKQEDILGKCHTENRNMTVDEKSTWDNLDKAIGEIEDMVEKEQAFAKRTSSLDDTYKDFNPANGPKKSDGFQSFGEMLVAVAAAGSPAGRFRNAGMIDPRLVQNAASGSSATVPSDGGFLISPTRSNEIMKKVFDGGAILNDCAKLEIGEYSDSFEVPYLEDANRATGSRWGGLRAYREGETDTPTSSKPSTGLWECRVTDMKALCYVTERLLNDAPALESLIMEAMPQEFTFKAEDEILNGTGGQQCTAIIGNAATVSIAKESGQAATTLLAENIVKQYSRCWGRSRSRAKWYINQDVEPQLFMMTMNVGTGGVPIFMPANGLSGSPYNTLFGKPLIPCEQCATLGTVGDIILADFQQYAIVRKGGFKSASSIHVKFLTDEMTFKFNMRINGKPKWKAVLTPYKGSSNTLSPFVTVANR